MTTPQSEAARRAERFDPNTIGFTLDIDEATLREIEKMRAKDTYKLYREFRFK